MNFGTKVVNFQILMLRIIIIYNVPNIYWVPNLRFLYLPKFYYCAEIKLVPKLIRAELHWILKNWCRSSCAEVHPCRSSITWMQPASVMSFSHSTSMHFANSSLHASLQICAWSVLVQLNWKGKKRLGAIVTRKSFCTPCSTFLHVRRCAKNEKLLCLYHGAIFELTLYASQLQHRLSRYKVKIFSSRGILFNLENSEKSKSGAELSLSTNAI